MPTGRVGGIAALYVAEGLGTSAMLSFVAGFSAASCAFSLLLPYDTTGVALKEYVDDEGLELIEVGPLKDESELIAYAWSSIAVEDGEGVTTVADEGEMVEL